MIEAGRAEAMTAFRDTLSATGRDPDHSVGENRFVIFGSSSLGRLLAVGHSETRDEVRIITARLATRAERRINEEG